MPFRLAILTTHPIQYYAPVFKLLAAEKNIELKVFYTLGNGSQIRDEGFGKAITWDIPLLEGYEYEFLENIAKEKGSHHFKGISNPNVTDRIDQFQPNVILLYGWAYQSHLNIMRHYSGKIPIWFKGDSTLLDRQLFLKSLLKKIYLRWVYRHVDRAFYVGSNNKKYFKHYGLKERQLTFAPHAIDYERFGMDRTVEAIGVRTRLGIEKEDVLILFAGKFEDKKDPLLLLKAFFKLRKENVHLLFVGNGVLEQELKEKSKDQQSRSNNIHFLAFQNQSQMPVIYQCCDLFCLPSKGPEETWGLSVNEAMAAGKAILVSDHVGCAIDLVKNDENGFIFQSNDLTSLAECLQTMIESKKLKEMGEISKAKIRSWSFSDQVNAIMSQVNKYFI
jgi:glycosyltransferase involved in cell wall biosynthesis